MLLQTWVPMFLHICDLHDLHSLDGSDLLHRSCPRETLQGTDNSHPWDVRANRTFAIIKANPFLQNLGEPWHLRYGNWSLPTHILRPKEDKNPSPVQGHETFIPAPGAGHLADQQLRRSRNCEEAATAIAQDGCQWIRPCRHFVSVASQEAGLDCSFSSGLLAVCFQREDSACQNQNPRTQWEGSFGIRQTPGFKVGSTSNYLSHLDSSPNLCFVIV